GKSHDLQVVAVGTPSHGSAVIYSEKYVKYTPAAGYTGTDSFTYTISDGTGTDTATVTVTVKAKEAKEAKPAKESKEKEKAKAKEASNSGASAAKVTAACQAHAASMPTLSALCGVYNTPGLPSWAGE